ncbi:hypothetical protein LPJ56_003983, partial [Coemansia sp. RSA 2599]
RFCRDTHGLRAGGQGADQGHDRSRRHLGRVFCSRIGTRAGKLAGKHRVAGIADPGHGRAIDAPGNVCKRPGRDPHGRDTVDSRAQARRALCKDQAARLRLQL